MTKAFKIMIGILLGISVVFSVFAGFAILASCADSDVGVAGIVVSIVVSCLLIFGDVLVALYYLIFANMAENIKSILDRLNLS